MQTEFIHKYDMKVFSSFEGAHDFILISYSELPPQPTCEGLLLRGALFCERLFSKQIPFIGYYYEPLRGVISRQCAKLHKNVYLCPVGVADRFSDVAESSLMVCNQLMWDVIKSETAGFDFQEYHATYNAYEVLIVP